MGDFLFGTSNWSEKSWAGVFYPSETPPGEYLAFYSTQFTTVVPGTRSISPPEGQWDVPGLGERYNSESWIPE